jgi:hypothetical protein
MSGKVLAALRAVEWLPGEEPFEAELWCPICRGGKYGNEAGRPPGHQPGCVVAAAIIEAGGETGPEEIARLKAEVARHLPSATEHVLPEQNGMFVVLDHATSPQQELGSGWTDLEAWRAALMTIERRAYIAGDPPEPLRGRVDWSGKTLREILDGPGWPAAMSESARMEVVVEAYDAHCRGERAKAEAGQTREERDAEVDRAFDLVDVEAEAWRLAQLAVQMMGVAWHEAPSPVDWSDAMGDAAGLMAAARAKARETGR